MLHTKGATEETLLKTSQECRPHPKAGVPVFQGKSKCRARRKRRKRADFGPISSSRRALC